MAATKKIRLTRAVIIDGEDHLAGSIHELPAGTAQMLIGHGSAVKHTAEGEDPEPEPTTVNRMETVTSRDPDAKQVPGKVAKVKRA